MSQSTPYVEPSPAHLLVSFMFLLIFRKKHPSAASCTSATGDRASHLIMWLSLPPGMKLVISVHGTMLNQLSHTGQGHLTSDWQEEGGKAVLGPQRRRGRKAGASCPQQARPNPQVTEPVVPCSQPISNLKVNNYCEHLIPN